jgi:hypothetical protein
MARNESEGGMTEAYSNARPPRWAEALLRLLLEPKNRESVSGDLLEEYRETIVPSRGSAYAGRWYVWQVGSFLFRSSWTWGAVLGGALVVRYLLDTLVPPTDYFIRATVLSYTVIGGCALAGMSAAWRTRSLTAGWLISIVGAILGGLLSIIGTAVMLAIWHDPATLQAWRNSGGLAEAFIDVPVKLVMIGAVMGFVGGLIGKLTAALLRRGSPQAT